MAYVTIRMKGVEGHTQKELDKERNVLGRTEKTDLSVSHTSISREHCAFVKTDGQWFIEDLGSSNGTWVNRDKVAGRRMLKERDIIKVGQARITFHAGKLLADGIEAAVDIDLDDDGGDGPKGPIRTAGPDDPPEAMPCAGCGLWFSFAHRLAGEDMACPRCGYTNVVPSMNT